MSKQFKVSRGSLEAEQRKLEKKQSNQKIALIVLPIIMVAVLLIGVYFGYKSYRQNYKDITVATVDSVVKGNIELTNDELLLTFVNSSSPLTSDFVPDLVKSCGVYVSPILKDSLEKMLGDAKKKGLDMYVSSGYISFEEQNKIYNDAIKKYRKNNDASVVKAESEIKKKIPKAGESEQQTGLLVYLDADVDSFRKSEQYSWLIRNCADYGFTLRYPDDDNIGGMGYNSHLFRYVGKENAINMRVLNMKFEEYVNYLSKH